MYLIVHNVNPSLLCPAFVSLTSYDEVRIPGETANGNPLRNVFAIIEYFIVSLIYRYLLRFMYY